MVEIKIPRFKEPDWETVPEQVNWLHKKQYYVVERSEKPISYILNFEGEVISSNPSFDEYAKGLNLPEGICVYFEETSPIILLGVYHLIERYFFSVSECMEIAYFLKMPMATIIRHGTFNKKHVELQALGFDQVLVRSFDIFKKYPVCFKVKYSNIALC